MIHVVNALTAEFLKACGLRPRATLPEGITGEHFVTQELIARRAAEVHASVYKGLMQKRWEP